MDKYTEWLNEKLPEVAVVDRAGQFRGTSEKSSRALYLGASRIN